MYIPNPIRCRKCLKLGHFADNCSSELICGFCSKPQHQGTPCETFVPICVNCKESHHSLDLKCPKFIEEKEIKTIQFTNKITYGAAKKQYRENNITTAKSYSEIVRKSKKGIDVECQTDTFIHCQNEPKHMYRTTNTTEAGPSELPPLPSPKRPSPLPPPPNSPTPLPAIPPPTTTQPPPSLPLLAKPSGRTDLKFPNVNEESVEYFKTSALPKRNITNKNLKKQSKKKNESNKSEDEMET